MSRLDRPRRGPRVADASAAPSPVLDAPAVGSAADDGLTALFAIAGTQGADPAAARPVDAPYAGTRNVAANVGGVVGPVNPKEAFVALTAVTALSAALQRRGLRDRSPAPISPGLSAGEALRRLTAVPAEDMWGSAQDWLCGRRVSDSAALLLTAAAQAGPRERITAVSLVADLGEDTLPAWRIALRLPNDDTITYPVCLTGRGDAPVEDWNPEFPVPFDKDDLNRRLAKLR